MNLNNKKITAVLGPTNTGKTHLAIETMLSFESGIIGFPLRLLAREVYDKIIQRTDISKVDNGLKKESVKYIKKINDLTARNAHSLKTYFENGFKIHKPEQFTQDFGGFK